MLISISRYELGDSELEGERGLVNYFVNTLRLLIGNFCNGKCKPGSSDVTNFSEPVELSQQNRKSNHHMQDSFSTSSELLFVCTACHERCLAVNTDYETFVPSMYCLKLCLIDSNAVFISRSATMNQLRS